MGKITGFLEYDRQTDPAEQPLDRIEHWKEFHPRLSEADRRQQGARCMECGVPFCQSGATLGGMTSGCPLHNLVPEWNDLLYTGNLPQALERLLKTNNFPEFTGRVCPALCEAACTCGLHGDPVTVRENELGIIEAAFERGLVQPRPPRVRSGKRVAVVGSGLSYPRQFAGQLAAGALEQGCFQLAGFGRMAFAYPSFAKDMLSGKGLDPKQCCVACGKCSQLMRLGSMAGCVVRDSVYTALYREAQQKATS